MDYLIDNISPKLSLSTTYTENLTSYFYKVEQFGFLRLSSSETFPASWYPTPSDTYPAGILRVDAHNMTFGDFNGDGLQDIIIQPILIEPALPRTTRIAPIFLLQDQSGGFKSPEPIISASNFPDKHWLYRIGIGDFNADGISDIALSAMAKPITKTEGIQESPVVIYGGRTDIFTWTDTFNNFQLSQGAPDWKLGYTAGHSMAVGDFNGDGHSDFCSSWDVFYNNPAGSFDTNLLISQWALPNVNSCVSSDFNEDGYDDLILSTMPEVDDGTWNGGDLWLFKGSTSGLGEFSQAIKIPRSNDLTGNIGTNFMVSADFNGDGHKDLFFVEHGWRDESNNSTNYYSLAKFRLFLGDGHGELTEHQELIVDPYSGFRTGEGILYVIDMNGDGWLDVVTSMYEIGGTSWHNSSPLNNTAVFLNHNGKLILEDYSDLAFVQPYQFKGEEANKSNLQTGTSIMSPIDIGNDGMVDFVGVVQTPFHQWPQTEPTYTYAFISKALKPLGRTVINEELSGTVNPDKIYGFDGNDTIDGSFGNDTIDGGLGSDTCVYSGLSANYTITKTSTGYNVQDTVGLYGADTLVNIEKLQFTDQTISIAPPIEGGGAKDKLTGTTDNDEIYGYAGNDTLTGLAGNDTLDGGTGDDSMTGGAGNDTYIADSIKDKIIEKTNEGTDTVITTATYTLANNVENLTLSGTSAINGTGNTASNIVAGNDAANSINGGLGSDTLTGGTGNDTFVFNTKLGATNIDTITDFTSGRDKIALDDAIFTKLKGDKDLSDNLYIQSIPGTSTQDTNDYLFYDFESGRLYYDADGSGTKSIAVVIAIIGSATEITATDFVII